MITLSIACLVLLALYAWQEIRHGRHTAQLMQRMDDLQRDNRALTEALVRVEGRPFVFRKPEPPTEYAETYFDTVRTNVNTE